jgi:hypothetical protein
LLADEGVGRVTGGVENDGVGDGGDVELVAKRPVVDQRDSAEATGGALAFAALPAMKTATAFAPASRATDAAIGIS